MNIKNQPEVVLTVTNESKKETFQLRGKAKEEKKLLSDILLHLTEKLNNDKNFTSTLPALNYKNQDKTVIKIKPYQIRMRKYNDNELEEKVIEISELDIK